jgi:hypothetical protein
LSVRQNPSAAAPEDFVHMSAELIGAAVALVGLGFLTLASVRSISRR